MNNCASCGKCCKVYVNTISLTDADVTRLRRDNPRVLDYVELIGAWGDAWFNPVMREELHPPSVCPFLRHGQAGYYCDIYRDRPTVCREYPHDGRDLCTVPLSEINVEITR